MKSDLQITGKELKITRVFNGPRQVVFSFWKHADKVQQWSGCKDATKCEVAIDFRVGGSFTQKMQIAGAGEFLITGTYDEIIEPKKIAYHADLGATTVRVLVEFFEYGNQTKVVLTQDGFPDENLCKIVSQGTTESLEKLEHVLAVKTV